MLLELVLGIQSPRGSDFLVHSRKNKGIGCPRAPSSVGRRNSMRVEKGRNSWSPLAVKLKARTIGVGRGKKSLLSDPESELCLGRDKEE